MSCSSIRGLGCVLCTLLIWSHGALVAAPQDIDAEPTYFIYHGQKRSLSLDTSRIGVRRARTVTGAAPTSRGISSEALARSGFRDSDLIDEPGDGWVVLDCRNALASAAAQTQSSGRALVPADTGPAIHSLIRNLAYGGDSSLEFISPVFTDSMGQPVLLSSRLLIGFEPNLSRADRQDLLATVPEGASLEPSEFPQPNEERWQLKAQDGFAVLARANALAARSGVTYAEPDMLVTGYADFVPNDSSFSQSWGLNNYGQYGGKVGFDLRAVSAWNRTLGIPSVIVAVLDDGVQPNHPDLNLMAGRDFTADAWKNPYGGPVGVYDRHGTAVAGCISERANNALGIRNRSRGESRFCPVCN